MFTWSFAKSAEAMFSRWAIKKVCKFLLKKKLGQLILGDIDLDQLDVQLSAGTIQLADLAVNVDYLNQKLGAAAKLAVKEGSIGSLLLKFPWKTKGFQIDVDELEIVLAPSRGERCYHKPEIFPSSQGVHNSFSHDLGKRENEMADGVVETSSMHVHEGVKTVAKMVKWLLTSFHVRIKKLIVALDPSIGGNEGKVLSKTLVLRINEIECGTGISDDVDPKFDATVDSLLGLNRLTNFVKFDGAILEFLETDAISIQSHLSETNTALTATTPIITGSKGGFSGTMKLSIPWKNGSLDISKVDADVNVDPLELRFQPSSIICFLCILKTFKEMNKNSDGYMDNKKTDSVYFNAAYLAHSATSDSCEFPTDRISKKFENVSTGSYSSVAKETVSGALLRGSHLISDWVASPIYANEKDNAEEPDFGASVYQFFECFDGLRNSQSALGSSGMWNWTCSVFSALTAASNLASGSFQIPSEQKHVETNLKASVSGISILFSFIDKDKRRSSSSVHYMVAEFQEIQLALQVCPRESNFEATVKCFEVADHFSNSSDVTDVESHDDIETQNLLIRNMQAAVQAACPPSFIGDVEWKKPREDTAASAPSEKCSANRCTCTRNCGGIYRNDVVKVLLLRTSSPCQAHFTFPSVPLNEDFTGPMHFSLKLPPFVSWVNFHLISEVLNLIREIGTSLEFSGREGSFSSEAVEVGRKASPQEDVLQNSYRQTSPLSRKQTFRGHVSVLNARVVLCFPCQKDKDFPSYFCWNQFVTLEISSPTVLSEGQVQTKNPAPFARPKEKSSLITSDSLQLNIGNLDIYAVTSASSENKCKHNPRFSAHKVLSVTDRRGCPSVFYFLWQESSVTGPWIAETARVLATSDGTSCRNKFMGKGYEFASVTTIKEMEDLNSLTRQEIISSSAFVLHGHLPSVTVNLESSLYKNLHCLLHQVGSWLTCISCDPDGDRKKSPVTQISINVECDSVEISICADPVEDVRGSIQNELPGTWSSLRLKVRNFGLLSVSDIGGIKGSNLLWLAHGEGNLWGSITGAPSEEFLLISCNNSSKGRGSGEGSNVLSSRSSGSDIVHLWDSGKFMSHASISIRCATIVAVGGRLDWLETVVSFFTLPSPVMETNNGMVQIEECGKDTCRSAFMLSLVDVGLSYEPYNKKSFFVENSEFDSCSADANGKMDEQLVAGLLAASSFKLSNSMVADSLQRDYIIKLQDIGLFLCQVSSPKDVRGSYSAQDLRKAGYAKVGEEAHIEAVVRMNCKNGHLWEVECCDSHIVLDTCHDTASGMIHLAAQLQRLYAPDIEESVVHLQTRWENIQQAHESDGAKISKPSTFHMNTSSLETNREPSMINLMDEITEGAFRLNERWDSQSGFIESKTSTEDIFFENTSNVDAGDGDLFSHKLSLRGAISMNDLENSETSSSQTFFPNFIEGYFLSDLRPLSELSLNGQLFDESPKLKSRSVKDGEARGGQSGWYGDSSFRILENHVLQVGDRTNLKEIVAMEAPAYQVENDEVKKARGCVLFTNINVKWRLYAGSEWLCIQKNDQNTSIRGRDGAICLELELSSMDFHYDIFPDGEVTASRLSLSIQDFHLNDNSQDAPWKLMFGHYQSKDHPRESCSKTLKVDLEAVRPHPLTPLEEYRLRIAFLPMRLHLHQHQLNFLVSFFGRKNTHVGQSLNSWDLNDSQMQKMDRTYVGNNKISEEALLPFFQKFDIWPVLIRVDYSPSHFDLAALRDGKYVELVNLVPWKGVELQLKHVQAVGVYGWNCVFETIIGEWLEDISQNQIHKLLKGLPPVRSLVAVGSGAAKLISLPAKDYKKDHRILKGMQRGTIAFLRSISLEAIGLGVHLAAGAHDILLQAEYILASLQSPAAPRSLQSRGNANVRYNQPKDAQQGIQQALESLTDGLGKSASVLVQSPLKKYHRGAGVGSALATVVQAAPVAAIAPASAAARAMHCALLGVRNSLDPEHKRESMEKYVGTSQSQPR